MRCWTSQPSQHDSNQTASGEPGAVQADQAHHPWTNGYTERMNRTMKDATTKVFHYRDLESLKAHIVGFAAYNFAKYLKALRWRTQWGAICQAWTKTYHPSKSICVTSSPDQHLATACASSGPSSPCTAEHGRCFLVR